MIEPYILSDLESQFLVERKSRNRSPKTIKLYSLELGYFLTWLETNNHPLTLDKLTPSILRAWLTALKTHRSKTGVGANWRIIKTFLNWIEFEYDLDGFKNPVKKIHMEPNRMIPLPEITLAEVQQLLDANETSRYALRNSALIRCFVDTGARGWELINMNREDVDLKTGSVLIKHGKGDKQRIVYLGAKTLKVVNDYLATRTDDNPALFVSDKNERFSFMGVRMIINRLCKTCGLKVYGLHAFRRCCSLNLYRKTKDIFFVSKYLGHSKVEVTLRYLNISNEDMKDSFKNFSPADLLN